MLLAPLAKVDQTCLKARGQMRACYSEAIRNDTVLSHVTSFSSGTHPEVTMRLTGC